MQRHSLPKPGPEIQPLADARAAPHQTIPKKLCSIDDAGNAEQEKMQEVPVTPQPFARTSSA